MLPMCSEAARNELIPVLEKYHLPTKPEVSADEVLPFVLHDKKRSAEGIHTVYVETPGSFEFQTLSPEELHSRMKTFLGQ